MPDLRIAIVNDLALATAVLRRVVETMSGCALAWTAADGREAVERCLADTPDIVLMDLVMPVMDGAEATRRIMAEAPCAVLVVTATVSGNLGLVYEAMGHGALDAVNMPVPGPDGRVAEDDPIRAKIRLLARLIGKGAGPARPPRRPAPLPHGSAAAPGLALIGSSTGGPRALADILGRLDPGFPAPILVVQHVDRAFLPGLRDWLAGLTRLPVSLLAGGALPVGGSVLLADTGDHLVMQADGSLVATPEPAGHDFRPSVDVLFESVARHWAGPGVAALLTGMGRDGARGLLALRESGFHTIAQDESSSVVFGMPKAAIELGAARQILPLPDIAGALTAALPPAPSR